MPYPEDTHEEQMIDHMGEMEDEVEEARNELDQMGDEYGGI